ACFRGGLSFARTAVAARFLVATVAQDRVGEPVAARWAFFFGARGAAADFTLDLAADLANGFTIAVGDGFEARAGRSGRGIIAAACCRTRSFHGNRKRIVVHRAPARAGMVD